MPVSIPFEPIRLRAIERLGGEAQLQAKLQPAVDAASLRAIPADRWLAMASQCIFQAGFKWSLVEQMWPGFERAFEDFDVQRWVWMSDEDADRLLRCKEIVRNYAKIRAVGVNAAYFHVLIQEYGSVGEYFSRWRLADYSQNLRQLQAQTKHLGAKTGQVFLRRMGVDTLIFSPDVVAALSRLELLDGRPPTSQRAWRMLQAACNEWHQQSGLGLNEISQILAWAEG